jgi:diguanylate cyclase (GGDEF)-like protein/PAS domain S-box-containing protein
MESGKHKNKQKSVATLRQTAEEHLREKTDELRPPLKEDVTLQLVHELEVHQIELEMQNAELRRVQEELEASRNKYFELYDFAPVAYFTLDATGLIREVNHAGARLLGIERHQLTNAPFFSFISSAHDRENFFSHLESALEIQSIQKCEIRLINSNGALIHAQLQSAALDTVKNEYGHILTSIIDGTAERLAAERMSEVLRNQQAILENIPDIVWLKDREGRYVAANVPFGNACGLALKDLIGKNDRDIYPPERAIKCEKESREVMANGIRTYFEESICDREGNTLYLEKIITPIFNDSEVAIGTIGIARDITRRKQTELTLRHESTHDTLTGLYNRTFFDAEIERISRSRFFPVSIVMADINGLKSVNDSLGHDAGDNLIRLVARILLRAFRSEDIIARIGGDEFGIILPGMTASVAEEVIKTIMISPEITSGKLSIAFGTASAENRKQFAKALKLSDERMYQDKSVKKKADQECREQKTFRLRRAESLSRHPQHTPGAVPEFTDNQR